MSRNGGVLGVSRRATPLSSWRFASVAAWGALSCACGVGLLATSGWLITRAATRPPVFVLSVAVGAVQAFALGRGLFRYLQRLGVHDISLEVLGALRLRLYDDVEPLVPGGLPGHGRGGLLNAFVADTEAVSTGLAQAATASVDVAASVVLGVVVAVLLSPPLAAVLAFGSLTVLVLALLATRLASSVLARRADRRAELAAAVVEAMGSARELAAYGRSDLVEGRLHSVHRRALSDAVRLGLASGFARAVSTWGSGATVVAVVAVGLGVQRTEHLSGVVLAVVVFATLAVTDQLSALPVALADVGVGGAAARRLADLAGRPAPAFEPAPGRELPPGPLSASLHEAVVAGSDGTAVLRGVSLKVTEGRRLALVGRSGAGKTSALYALLHFVECRSGRASVGGVDVRDVGRTTLAHRVGWMAEETHVFAATVADNLRIARPEAMPAECAEVLRRVGLGGWLASLPQGLDTVLGAGGQPASAGERQRLGMARVLLAGGDLVLLDEPTSHVDATSAGALLSELLAVAAGRSVVVVSHEPDIGRLVDDVVILEEGRTLPGPGRSG